MYRLTIIFSTFLLWAGIINAQINTTDTVSLKPNYTESVFYSLKQGTVKSVPNNGWHIALDVRLYEASVRINDAIGVELYLYQNGDTTHWNCSNFDTTGLYTWKPYYNQDTSWSVGAFQYGTDWTNDFDMGWGKYDMVTHNVVGDSLYLIKLPDGSWKRIFIVSLANRVWTIRYSDLDCSNEQTIQIDKQNYPDKNFVYLNLTTNQILDLEPNNSQWNLIFTRYVSEVAPGSYYLVSGVLQNTNTIAAEIRGIPSSQANWQNATFQTKINTIGHDWKYFDMNTFSYVVEDSLTYFVEDTTSGEIYKIVFTGFDGKSTGNIYFSKEKVATSSVKFLPANDKFLKVHYNPTSNNLFIRYEKTIPEFDFTIYTIAGQKVFHKNIIETSLLKQGINIKLPELKTGIYILRTNTGASRKLFINRF